MKNLSLVTLTNKSERISVITIGEDILEVGPGETIERLCYEGDEITSTGVISVRVTPRRCRKCGFLANDE